MAVGGTVVTLITRGCNKKKNLEYRVAHVPETDSLISEPNYPSKENPVINRDFALKFFGDCRVIHNEASAEIQAKQLAIKNNLPEEKIVEIKKFPNINFPAYKSRGKMLEQRMTPKH